MLIMLTQCQPNSAPHIMKRGTIMPKGSTELTNARREEIINACGELYKTMSFKEITIKEIGNATSFTRTSIYNYFTTKEEIFLALLQREYEGWANELLTEAESGKRLTSSEFAALLAKSLDKRPQLLKILSMNHYDMETNSRLENLVEFKRAYKKTLDAVDECLIKFFPEMDGRERTDFIYSFFPFMFGIYPYTVITEKQKSSMKQADLRFPEMTIYEIVYQFVSKMLKNR